MTFEPREQASEPQEQEERATGAVGVGTVLAGRYRLDVIIGSGGMARVYRGEDTLLRRTVAVKVLGDALTDEKAQRRFVEEAQAAAALSHPNIAAVYDAGTHGDLRYIIMEYVPGGSLRELLDRQGPLTPARAIDVVAQVADALDYGHRHGIVHCDVKPQNILLDQSGKPKLVDFGISRVVTATMAHTATVMGTPAYLAPEQVEGARLDGRTDVYALGLVLYELLTGTLPFQADNVAALATQRLVRDPVPLRQRNPALSPELEAIVMTALARDVNQRFPTAGEFAAALREFVAGAAAQATQRVAAARARAAQAYATAAPPRESAAAEPSRPTWPLWVLGGALVLLVAAIAAVFAASLLTGNVDGGGPPVALPDVRQQRLDEAAVTLQQAGFDVGNITFTNNPAPFGSVIEQRPDPGAQPEAPRGSDIELTVSLGPTSQ
ncbi:MAG TPA: protein kinase [Dehalococcoidia bacterium]